MTTATSIWESKSVLRPKAGGIDPAQLFIPPHLVLRQSPHPNISRVGDQEIDLRCAIARPNVPAYARFIRSTSFDDPTEYKLAVEVLFLGLNFDHFAAERWRLSALHPSNLHNTAYCLRALLRRMREDGISLHEVKQDWLDAWLDSARHLDSTTLIKWIGLWRRIALYTPLLSFEGVDFLPWGERSASRITGHRARTENKTPRIPEEIYGPAMRWAFFYMDHALDDVLTSRRWLEASRSHRAPPWVSDERLRRYVAELRRDGKRVPTKADGEPAWFIIARESGLSIAVVQARRSLIEDAIAELGSSLLDEEQGWASLSGCAEPWRTGIAGQLGRASSREIQHCIAACYLVIGVLSGMRDSEVTNLRDGCLEIELNHAGNPMRYIVRGRIFKGKKDIEGAEHKWVVIEPVARAIAVLGRIKAHLTRTRRSGLSPHQADLLFIQPTESSVSSTLALTEGMANGYLNSFVDHCHGLALQAAQRCGAEAATVKALFCIPPDERGFRWQWTSKQLRRTLAWFIANQPFGVAAGRIQFGHAADLMFEGYAGTSPSGFRDEIEQERELARMTDIVELYEDHISGHSPGGPFGRRLGDEFDSIQRQLEALPGVVVSDERRNKMLKNLAVTLHPGFLNDCFYYPDHALCRLSGDTDQGPRWSACQPAKCPNSCVSQKHRVAITECIDDAQTMKKVPGLSNVQVKTIANQIDVYESLLASSNR
ncbi:hypothetical protein [Allosphingosinicella humi]